jgi:hypothetical protein
MSANETALLYRCLEGINCYFEFGSGGSTAAAALRAQKVISVESDARWHRELRERMGVAPNVVWYTVDLKVRLNGWGHPGSDSPKSDWPNYTHAYNSSMQADVILIDGRFRVACGLCVFSEIGTNTLVVIHDFVPRPHYWVLLKWYDLVDLADSLVVLRKNPTVVPPAADMIAWYDTQPMDRLMPSLSIPKFPAIQGGRGKAKGRQ